VIDLLRGLLDPGTAGGLGAIHESARDTSRDTGGTRGFGYRRDRLQEAMDSSR
jgi:hypothetical protein